MGKYHFAHRHISLERQHSASTRQFPQQWLFQLWSSGLWYDVFLQLNRSANVSEKCTAPVLRAGLENSRSTKKNRECHYPVLTALSCWSFVLQHRQQNKTLDSPSPSRRTFQLLPQIRDSGYCVYKWIQAPPTLWVQKHTDLRAHFFAHSPGLWHQLRLTNITCAWSWRLCEINPAIHSSSSQISSALLARCNQWDFLNKRLSMNKNMLFIN